jgi:hypothetical protein
MPSQARHGAFRNPAGAVPQPPNLSKFRADPREAFWVIKHGIKMSAMPAWGLSHDDAMIWSMVAFVQKLPDMTPQQYQDIVARAPPDEDREMGDDAEHGHEPPPSRRMPDRNSLPRDERRERTGDVLDDGASGHGRDDQRCLM